MVVGVAVFFFDEVGVVGGYEFDAVLACEGDEVWFDLHLLAVGVGVGVGFVGAVTHEFDVVVVAEAFFEPEDGAFGSLEVAFEDELGYLAAEACGADDEAFAVLLQHVVVDAGAVVEAVDVGYGGQFAEVVVAAEVLCQEDEVVAGAVDDAAAAVFGVDFAQVAVFVVEGAAGAVGFGADDGLEDLPPRLLQLFAQGAEVGGAFGEGGVAVGFFHLLDLGFQLFDARLDFAVFFVDGVEEVLDAVHVAVVGEGQAVHAAALGLGYEVGDFRHAVEHGVVRVHVEVGELRHRRGALCVDNKR